uniref:Putative ribosomal protein var1 n=1 Tax=Starmerella bacillaris TaxID=1247836 RepID=Q6ED47_STABA|nr:putative ribosomal protein var1 [Starmerella bacillaris]AAR10343.2 putative ribosomal protein var1 [Starmerella bacillaris]
MLEMMRKMMLNMNKLKLLTMSNKNMSNKNMSNFNYNNNNMMDENNMKHKYIPKTYIKGMLFQTSKYGLGSMKLNLNILYKEPMIKYKKNNYEMMLFMYQSLTNNNTRNKLMNKMMKKLINMKNNEMIMLNKKYMFNIKPMMLLYDYLDSNMLSKNLSKYMYKNPKTEMLNNLRLNYEKRMYNMLKNKKNKEMMMKKLKLNNNYMFNPHMMLYNMYNKLMMGNMMKYQGKNKNMESNARSLKWYQDNKLNTLLSSNMTKSQNAIISKNGKFNIKMKLNHF